MLVRFGSNGMSITSSRVFGLVHIDSKIVLLVEAMLTAARQDASIQNTARLSLQRVWSLGRGGVGLKQYAGAGMTQGRYLRAIEPCGASA
jgi:hypothetical protein